jgi:hypothetical protein
MVELVLVFVVTPATLAVGVEISRGMVKLWLK